MYFFTKILTLYFLGICDFQYLPVSNSRDGTITSVKDKIFPVLGKADNPESFVMKELVNDQISCQTFSLPPAMSRVDNPPVMTRYFHNYNSNVTAKLEVLIV